MFEAVGRDARLSDKVTEAILGRSSRTGSSPATRSRPSASWASSSASRAPSSARRSARCSAKGLLEVRGGSGVRIVAVDEKTVRESMRHFVSRQHAGLRKVDEVRRVLEVAAAGIAAERATAADLERIDETIGRWTRACDDLETSIQVDLAFHRALAEATHNELFRVLHDSIGEMLVEVRRRNLSLGPQERRRVIEMHTAHPRPRRRARPRGRAAGDARPPRSRPRHAGAARRLDVSHGCTRCASAERQLGLLAGHHLEQRGAARRDRGDAALDRRRAGRPPRSTRSA